MGMEVGEERDEGRIGEDERRVRKEIYSVPHTKILDLPLVIDRHCYIIVLLVFYLCRELDACLIILMVRD